MNILKSNIKIFKDQRGQVTLVTVLVIIAASAMLISGIGLITFNEIRKIDNVVKSSQSLYASEAGAEDALLRVTTGMSYSNPGTYTIAVGGASTSVDISGPLDNLTIISTGDQSSRIRKVAVNINAIPSNTDAEFNYGIQVGAGGLQMDSNSKVIGNVYSNGSVTGASSKPQIEGDIFSAEAGGIIEDMDILPASGGGGGNAHAHTINDSDIADTAFCQVGTGNNKTCTFASDPDVIPLPISDSQITTWKNQAEAGGTLTTTTIGGGQSLTLGPKKIDGDLIIETNGTLEITGVIWVTGDITVNSNTLVYLHSSFGTESGHIVSDGKIVIDSNVTVCGSAGGSIGSCNPSNDSYVMFLSTNSSVDPISPAIDMSSNTTLAILYAHNGMAVVNANTNVFEVTAYQLKINSNAEVTYVSGLADVNFSSGPGGTFTINSWAEVQ